ncbi:MAG: selenide, water dikinase SelD [Candidatus Thorarchaeota archaeon]|nr:MAG: selenide, water dikinase SelD [Candidatus Thorarchaeota archaeon]
MVRIINDDIAIVENVDIFTPIHDDPHIQGEIVACNATNDVFSMGATDIVSLQAFLAYPKDLPEEIVVGVLKGMSCFMKDLGSKITGGQTIHNPCPVFGGIALGVTHPRNLVYSSGAKPGDVAVLTKPLGVQPVMRSYRDLQDEKRNALLTKFDEASLREMQDIAVRIMTKSNLEVARAMNEVGVSAATDITGFGLLGHANNVSELSGVQVIIDSLPVIKGSLKLADFFGHKLASGFGAETAGGILTFMESTKVELFKKLLAENGLPCWTVGKAVKSTGSHCASLAQDIQFIETEFP